MMMILVSLYTHGKEDIQQYLPRLSRWQYRNCMAD